MLIRFFFTSHSSWLKGALLQGTTRYGPTPKDRAAFSVRIVIDLCHLDRSLSPASLLFDLSSPKMSNHPPPITRRPLAVPISICYPNPRFVYVVSLGSLWSNFTTINHKHSAITGDNSSYECIALDSMADRKTNLRNTPRRTTKPYFQTNNPTYMANYRYVKLNKGLCTIFGIQGHSPFRQTSVHG